jgi:RimJ/RimL family protein N-acetyltransferase
MQIRPVKWSDFHDIIDNYYSIYDEVQENPKVGINLFAKKPPLADEARWFGKLYADILEGKQFAAVAEVEGRVVGLCHVGHRYLHEELQHTGELGILIRSGFRSQGIGSALLTDVLAQCKGKLELVRLSVFSNNEVAQHLYTKFGFVRVGRIPRHTRRGSLYLDEDIMQLDMAAVAPRSLSP